MSQSISPPVSYRVAWLLVPHKPGEAPLWSMRMKVPCITSQNKAAHSAPDFHQVGAWQVHQSMVTTYVYCKVSQQWGSWYYSNSSIKPTRCRCTILLYLFTLLYASSIVHTVHLPKRGFFSAARYASSSYAQHSLVGSLFISEAATAIQFYKQCLVLSAVISRTELPVWGYQNICSQVSYLEHITNSIEKSIITRCIINYL